MKRRRFNARVWRPVARRWGKPGLAAALGVAMLLVGGGAYAAFIAGGAQNNNVNLSNGLVGWWKMDGDASDASGNADNLTVNNATSVADRTGKANSAYSFTGATNSNLYKSTVSTALDFTADFSLSIWIDPTSYHTTGYFGLKNEFLAKGNASTYNYALQATDATTISFIKRTGTEGLQFFNFTGVPSLTNNWTLVTVTYSGTTLSLYLDGAFVGSKTVTNIGPGTNDPFYLGSVGGNSEQAFTGSTDEARIYNRALNAYEAKALYTQHNSFIKAAQGENGLVGWWKLDGNAKDATPNANNGTLVNAPTPTTDRKGTANAAYSFNGSNQSITLTGNMFTNSDFTISLWAKPSTITDAAYHAMVGTQGATHRSPSLYVAPNGGLHYDSYDSTGATRYSNVYAGFFTSTTAWVHIVWVKSGTTYTFYRNGTQYATATAPAGTVWDNPVYEIGHIDNYMAGALDDIRIYNRALSQADVTNLYSSYNSQLAIGGSPGSSVQLGRGLVGDWPMNGNAKDATPYGNNANLVNGPVLAADRKGRPNSAYSFNGTSSYMAISNFNSSFMMNGQEGASWTMSIWAKTTADSNSIVFGKVGYNGGILNDTNQYLFELWDTSNVPHYITKGGIDTSQWHMLTGVYAAGAMSFYVDGQLAGTGTEPNPMHAYSTTLGIGSGGSASWWYNGTLDDARVWNRALSSAEVSALYKEYR